METSIQSPSEASEASSSLKMTESKNVTQTSSNALLSQEELMVPLMNTTNNNVPSTNPTHSTASSEESIVRSRKMSAVKTRRKNKHSHSRRSNKFFSNKQYCCHSPNLTRYMQVLARLLIWASFLSLSLGVVWYSYELTKHGTDPHLIAWFSAGAFVLMGFPISMWGIVMHLLNYNQPNVQAYVVRILWMVPIYSMESWLCLRFHKYAIYIETLRDCYESYVLYCFLQFLIQVLGGEEELINILRTKSPTRGVHMWGLQWCVRPWLMGQPVSRISSGKGGKARVQWTSPFFKKCKFGVLQYVLLKFVSSIFVMILELNGLYKEGDFTPTGGYLYICILTNLSQCWALYCLIFFYYATKNELGPIRPVGKFLSVKALVFFTWWQSVGISILYQMDMIPHYHAKEEWTSEAVAKGLQDYLICIEMFLAAIVHVFVFPHTDYLKPISSANRRVSVKQSKRLGRKMLYGGGRYPWRNVGDGDSSSKNSGYDYDLELASHASSTDTGGLQIPASGSSGLSPLAQPPQDSFLPSHLQPNLTLQQPPLMPSPLREGEHDDDDEDDDSETDGEVQDSPIHEKPIRRGFVSALLDSTIPRDVVDSTAGIVKGEYHVEKRTLLHHATTADQYDLFGSKSRFHTGIKKTPSTEQQQP